MLKIIKNWLPVILWASIIFFFSSNPDPYRYLPESWRSAVPLPSIFRACEGLRVFFAEHTAAELLGQLMHFLEYTVLALLLMRALTITLPTSSKINLITIVFSILYAFSDELHQLLVPGRSFQLIDLLIDFLGIITGTFLFNKIMKKR